MMITICKTWHESTADLSPDISKHYVGEKPTPQIGEYWDCVQVCGHSFDVNYDYTAEEQAITQGHPDRRTEGRAASADICQVKLFGNNLSDEMVELLREDLEKAILELRQTRGRYED